MNTVTVDADTVLRTLEMLADFATSTGHLAQRVTNENRGVCPHTGCAPSCREFGALLDIWTDMLSDMNAREPLQLPLLTAPQRAARRRRRTA